MRFSLVNKGVCLWVLIVHCVEIHSDSEHDGRRYLEAVFYKYQTNGKINLEGFKDLMKNLGLTTKAHHHHHEHEELEDEHETHSHNHSLECLESDELWRDHGFDVNNELDEAEFAILCPSLLYQLDTTISKCVHSTKRATVNISVKVWVYAFISVLVISLCGMFGVAVVPIMQLVFYHQILQFFVAVAVGSLSGDALLHLLPHALTSSHSSEDSDGHHGSEHESATVLKGLAALGGFFFFFLTEKLVAVLAECRKEHKNRNKVMEIQNTSQRMVGKKLSKHHQYTTYSYNLQDVGLSPNHVNETTEDSEHHHNCYEKSRNKENYCNENNKSHVDHSHIPLMKIENGRDGGLNEKTAESSPTTRRKSDEDDDVIITRHENMHHGHSHAHGHVHSRPSSMIAVAWMVILGDGIHNFTDGLIIGAAFANSITGGLSTSIAVFCHELPHEIGDFAVLLKTGMNWKQALFYNGVSSFLCLFGMVVGVCLGTMERLQPWIFSVAAGMFLYIALVDMIPELNNVPSGVHVSPGAQLSIQCAGMLCGMGIMLAIALNEHALMHLFNED